MSDSIKWISTTPSEAWASQELTPSGKLQSPNLQFTDRKQQVWEGFGGCFNELGWIALSVLPEEEKDKVIKELFDPEDGCRLNICRLPIGASDYAAEWYSHNEVEGDFTMEHFSIERDRHYLIPYIKKAMKLRPDMKLFASPWSPPTWFKFPKAHNYGKMMWKKEYLDAYALYFLKFVQAYKDEGITIDQIHVQNEPVADQKFPSCLWTGAELRDFIRDHLGPLFESQKVQSEIWLGTLNTADYDGFVHTALTDPEAAKYISGVGFQYAGKNAIQRTSTSWPNLRTMQTENECGEGKNIWEFARYVFGLLWHYITNGANGYIYWNMILQPEGMSTWGWKQNSMVTIDLETKKVTYNPEFYVMKHFSRFIEPGAVRLELSGDWAGNTVAFSNPDGSTVIIVNNPFNEKRKFNVNTPGGSIDAVLAEYSFNTFVITSEVSP